MSKIIAFAASTQTAAYFTFNHINKTIVGTEFNFKMSGNPTKPQYPMAKKETLGRGWVFRLTGQNKMQVLFPE